MMVEFLRILDVLHAKENEAKKDGQREEHRDQLLLAALGGPDGHGHGKAAGKQDHGVEATQLNTEGVAAHRESVEVGVAVDGVRQHDAAKEHDFRHQEDPHSERGSILLLLQGIELSVQRSGAMHFALPYPSVSGVN